MKTSVVALVSCGLVLAFLNEAVAKTVNYDESKIPPYTLEDPLAFADGTKLTSPVQWPARRKEILDVFQREMYGRMPPPPEDLCLDVFEQGETVSGFVIRKQVKMTFRKDRSGPFINWLMLYPKSVQGPVPAFIFLNYCGNQTLLRDKEVPLMTAWARNDKQHGITNNRVPETSRGEMTDPDCASVCPVGMLAARGYAVVTACYCEVSPDPVGADQQEKMAYTGIFDLWPKRDPSRTDNTTSLNAWAWALMRGLDMIEKEPALDAKRAVVTGCSRLGKAALIAGAFDERFAVVAPNQTGGGGAPLAKRYFGENVETEMASFTHWYCKAYGKYAGNEQALPFDQHLLLAAVAPRALLIQGFDSKWFDTKGEFLACRAAAPVWTFLGRPSLPDVEFPDDFDTKAIGGHLGYVRRPGPHGISFFDWTWMMDFADKIFGK